MSDARYHDLNATDRDVLLAAATATATRTDYPSQRDVRRRLDTIRDGDGVTDPTVTNALERLEAAGAVWRKSIGRRNEVRVTDDGRALLDAAGDALTTAAYAVGGDA